MIFLITTAYRLRILLNLDMCQEASIGIFQSRSTFTIFPEPSRNHPVQYSEPSVEIFLEGSGNIRGAIWAEVPT